MLILSYAFGYPIIILHWHLCYLSALKLKKQVTAIDPDMLSQKQRNCATLVLCWSILWCFWCSLDNYFNSLNGYKTISRIFSIEIFISSFRSFLRIGDKYRLASHWKAKMIKTRLEGYEIIGKSLIFSHSICYLFPSVYAEACVLFWSFSFCPSSLE